MKKIEIIYQTLVQAVEKNGVPGNFQNLREKGVECAIIMPLLEHLGYDALKDVQYEVPSPKRTDQRFDFVFGDAKHIGTPKEKYHLVLETKSLDTKIDIGSHGSNQIQEYILHHNDIFFGILTNGIDYIFFLQKDFILEVLQKKDFATPGYGSIIPIFSIGRQEMLDGKTLAILNMFNKEDYIENITKLAHLTYKTITGDGVKREILVGDKETNEHIRKRIEECLVGQRGELFDLIVEKKLKEDDLIKYKNPHFSIVFKVSKFGKILLEGKDAIIVEKYNELIKEEYGRKIRDIADQLVNNKNMIIAYKGIEDFLLQIFNREQKVPDSKPIAKELREALRKSYK